MTPAPPVENLFPVNDIIGEWLGHALSTEPADRNAAEQAIAALYALVNRPPPEFVWVESPHAAARLTGPPSPVRFDGNRTADQRIASLVSDLRGRLGPRSTVDQTVRSALRQSIRHGIAGTVRQSIDDSVGLVWFGQHEVDWIACHDAAMRRDSARFRTEDVAQWELWATLARSCGWWFPREDHCVVAERPAAVHTESFAEGMRLHCEDGPAVEFRDGTAVHVWHGTRVPSWVIDDPTAERISAEPNIEVRRCAVERIGWTTFLEQAGLGSVGRADDPANNGFELQLYDLPWSRRVRLLLAVNGSVERDGTRRQYGLYVPSWFDHPVDAAAWTYGLTFAQYATLARRT